MWRHPCDRSCTADLHLTRLSGCVLLNKMHIGPSLKGGCYEEREWQPPPLRLDPQTVQHMQSLTNLTSLVGHFCMKSPFTLWASIIVSEALVHGNDLLHAKTDHMQRSHSQAAANRVIMTLVIVAWRHDVDASLWQGQHTPKQEKSTHQLWIKLSFKSLPESALRPPRKL